MFNDCLYLKCVFQFNICPKILVFNLILMLKCDVLIIFKVARAQKTPTWSLLNFKTVHEKIVWHLQYLLTGRQIHQRCHDVFRSLYNGKFNLG